MPSNIEGFSFIYDNKHLLNRVEGEFGKKYDDKHSKYCFLKKIPDEKLKRQKQNLLSLKYITDCEEIESYPNPKTDFSNLFYEVK